MPVIDAYATLAEYKTRITKTKTSDDASITAALPAVSRYVDKECGRFFTQDAAAVARVYDGNGLTRLYIDDLATVTDLAVKVDINGDWDYADPDETLTIDTHFWPGPANAALGAEPSPYLWLDLVPNNARLSRWARYTLWPGQTDYGVSGASQIRAVQVTGKWGWPAVPGAIKELTIALTHYLLGLERVGLFTATIIESTLETADDPDSRRIHKLLRDIKDRYSRKHGVASRLFV